MVVENGKKELIPHTFGLISLGNDLGLAFEIPQNLRNQAFFASCVLKVSSPNEVELWFKSRTAVAMVTPKNCNNLSSYLLPEC